MKQKKICSRCGQTVFETLVICNKCGSRSFSKSNRADSLNKLHQIKQYSRRKYSALRCVTIQPELVMNLNSLIKIDKIKFLFIIFGMIIIFMIIHLISWSNSHKISGNAEILQRDLSGHFYAEVFINGTPIKMLVDTGATKVVLPLDTALRIGITKTQLSSAYEVQTADGNTRVAETNIRQVRLGSIIVEDVEAWILLSSNKEQEGLLGMSFLNRLSSWNQSGSTLTFEP